MIQGLVRKLEFARHMPTRKLARRMELSIRRRFRDRFAPNVEQVRKFHRAPLSPLPVFDPRRSLAPSISSDGEISFKFLNRVFVMPIDNLDWNAPGAGGENQLLRMNLHYMEYLEGVDDDVWNTLVSGWIEQNGRGGSGTWRDSWNSYALSIRTVVWMQEMARRRERFPEAWAEIVDVSIFGQIRFLEDNLETDLGGNHLIKNIKALLWAGAYFDGSEATRWHHKALILLERELHEQILADGMHYERSPSYHCQVFADLLECRQILRGEPFCQKLDLVLVKMAQATAEMQHPDGLVAQFNDAGLNMAYAPAECLAVYERLRLTPVERRDLFRYDDAGYYGMRADQSFLVIDCGAIAPDDLPAHGHGDVLSFEWSVNGRRVIVDQGVYEYVEGVRRSTSRSAQSHNTLCLDQADQADFFGAFRCGRRPKVDLSSISMSVGKLVLSGQHDGFSHLPGKPVHKRTFKATASQLEIMDAIEGNASCDATVRFLLHPDIVVQPHVSQIILRFGDDEILVKSSREIVSEPAVWWPDMGVEVKTNRLSVHMPKGQPRCHTVFEVRKAA